VSRRTDREIGSVLVALPIPADTGLSYLVGWRYWLRKSGRIYVAEVWREMDGSSFETPRSQTSDLGQTLEAVVAALRLRFPLYDLTVQTNADARTQILPSSTTETPGSVPTQRQP